MTRRSAQENRSRRRVKSCSGRMDGSLLARAGVREAIFGNSSRNAQSDEGGRLFCWLTKGTARTRRSTPVRRKQLSSRIRSAPLPGRCGAPPKSDPMLLETRPKLLELRSMLGSPRLVWLRTLVNVPSKRTWSRSVMEKLLLSPADRLTRPGPSTEPTWLLPKRPMGRGLGLNGAPVSGLNPAPVVQALPGVQVESPGHANAAPFRPVETSLSTGVDADARELVRMLRAMATVEAACAIAEFAVEPGASTRGIPFAVGEIGRFVRPGLNRQDGGEPPAASDQIGDPVHRIADQLAAAKGQVVKSRRVPAQPPCSIDVAEVHMAIEDGSGALAAALPGEAVPSCDRTVGTLIVGQRFLPM